MGMLAGLAGSVRRNHALEHATVSVLMTRHGPSLRLIGRAVPDGFYLYSDISAETVREAADEALLWLRSGESHLAVSPLCGTNLVVVGSLSALAAVVTAGGGSRHDRWGRLPNVLSSALLATLAAQPLGRWVQQHVTTSADLSHTRIVDVRERGGGRRRALKVVTARD